MPIDLEADDVERTGADMPASVTVQAEADDVEQSRAAMSPEVKIVVEES